MANVDLSFALWVQHMCARGRGLEAWHAPEKLVLDSFKSISGAFWM